MINIIVAKAQNRVIGKDKRVPWRLRNDFIRLKSLTMGRVVILGRKTYDSLAGYYERSGRSLPASMYIIVTRQQNFRPMRENTTVAHSFGAALEIAKKLSDEIFVIGGAQIFEEALKVADRLYVTEVTAEVDGDTFFPQTNPKDWVERTRERHHKNNDHMYDYHFVIYDKLSG